MADPFVGPPEAEQLARDTGALLIGNRTFGGDDPNKGTDSEGAFGGTWDGPSFVLTHSPPQTSSSDVVFVSDLATGLAAAKAAAGDRYVNVLGADVARQCLEAGELDEVLAFVAPVMLGDGTPLFGVPGGRHVDLTRRSVAVLPHAVMIWMDVVR